MLRIVSLAIKEYKLSKKNYNYTSRYLLGGIIHRMFFIILLSIILKINLLKVIFIYNEKYLQKIVDIFNSKISKENFLKLGIMSQIQLEILYSIVRLLKPKVIVETGVASGSSSFFILSAILKNKKGKLFSIDLPISLPKEFFYQKKKK